MAKVWSFDDYLRLCRKNDRMSPPKQLCLTSNLEERDEAMFYLMKKTTKGYLHNALKSSDLLSTWLNYDHFLKFVDSPVILDTNIMPDPEIPSPVDMMISKRIERIPLLGNPKTGLPRV